MEPELDPQTGLEISDHGDGDSRRYPPSPHLDRIYTEIKNRLDLQRTELDDLQRIVAIVLTANGVVLGFAGGQFPSDSNHVKLVVFIVAVAALAVDIVVGILALWPKDDVKTLVDPQVLVDDYAGSPTNVMLFDLIAAANSAYKQNEDIGIRKRRSRLVRAQLFLLGVGAVTLGVGMVISHV